MIVLELFNTLGLIFGPLVFLVGIVALALCLRATKRPDSSYARRTALFGSLAPFVAGICAVIFGLIYCGILGLQVHWLDLGKACLAGLVVTAIPLLWSLMLFRAPRAVV
jgi:hypothetical protein